MRQTLKDRRLQLYRSTSMSRMATLVLMMAIMGLIFVRLRDPETWRCFARDQVDETLVVSDEDQAVVKPAPRTPSALARAAASSAAAAPSAAAASATTPSLAASSKSSGDKPSGDKAAVANPKSVDSGKTPPAAIPAAAPAVPEAREIAATKDSSAAPELTPTGPTDLDPTEQEDIHTVLSLIRDGNQEMTKYDMPAYYQILNWVDHQSIELLRKRAKKDVHYSDFRKTPESMRLQIVELNLNVRQIVRYTNAPVNGITQPMKSLEGHPIFEVRGFTNEGGSNVYIGVVTELPKGMPIGDSLNENVKLVGYFFRLQGYISQAQQLEAEHSRRRPTPLQAPIIMGRLIWTPAPPENVAKAPVWLLLSIGSVAAVVVVGWVYLTSRRARQRILPAVVPGPNPDPDAPSVDNWLDQAQSGRLTLPVPETARYDGGGFDNSLGGRFSGNSIWENSEYNNGHASNNGHGRNLDDRNDESGPEMHDGGNPA